MVRRSLLAAVAAALCACSGSSSTTSSGSSGASTTSTSTSSSSTSTTASSSGSSASTGSSGGSSSSSSSASSSGSTGSSASGSTASTSSGSSGSNSGSGSTGTTACGGTGSTGLGGSGGTNGGGDDPAFITYYGFASGDLLAPTDACAPGTPSPGQVALAAGKAWVVLGNINDSFVSAGPSFLQSYDLTTGDTALHELDGCVSAFGIAAQPDGDGLIVGCTDDYVGDGSVLRFSVSADAVTDTWATGGAPGNIAILGDSALVTDFSGAMVIDLRPDAGDAVIVDANHESEVCSAGFFAGIATEPGATGALGICSHSPDSTAALVAADGTLLPDGGGTASFGASALSIASVGSSTFLLLLPGEVDIAAVSDSSVTIPPYSIALPANASPTAIAASPDGSKAFVTLSGLDQVALLDSNAGLVAVAQLPAGSDPANIVSESASTAWVTLYGSSQVARVQFVEFDDGGVPDAGPIDAADAGPYDAADFITSIVSFDAGANGGAGADQLPGIIEGPPVGGGTSQGSTDTLSLGTGGTIVVELGKEIVDGTGVDFTVFENAFASGNGFYIEPAQVSVSDDGQTWTDFPCFVDAGPSCAGLEPVLSSPQSGISPLDPSVSGGDTFDLADIGVSQARYVKIHDLGIGDAPQTSPSAGFDLDAIAVVHAGN